MIDDKEILKALKQAEKRVLKKIKKRMEDLANDTELREQMEREIHKCLTSSTSKESGKKGKRLMKPKVAA